MVPDHEHTHIVEVRTRKANTDATIFTQGGGNEIVSGKKRTLS